MTSKLLAVRAAGKGRQPSLAAFQRAASLAQAHPKTSVLLTWGKKDNSILFYTDERGVFWSRRT